MMAIRIYMFPTMLPRQVKQLSPRDELWLNNQDCSFTNVINQTSIDTTIGPSFWNMSSGCHWGDYNNDGFMDLLASSLCHPRFNEWE